MNKKIKKTSHPVHCGKSIDLEFGVTSITFEETRGIFFRQRSYVYPVCFFAMITELEVFCELAV